MTLHPGDPFTPQAVREDGRRLERLLGDAGFPGAAVEPDVDAPAIACALTWVLKLGPRVRVGPMFVRGNFMTEPETILEQIPLQSGGYLTTTAVERGQRNLGFLQLFNNATPITFPGKEEQARGACRWWSRSRSATSSTACSTSGVGVSTEQKPPDSSIPFGVYLRGGYENRNLWGHGWNNDRPSSPTARRCSAAPSGSSIGASSARCSASTPR